MNKEIIRMEKISGVLEKYTSTQVLELKQSILSIEDRIDKWRVGIEDTEGKKIVELHSAMKLLNGNFTKL